MKKYILVLGLALLAVSCHKASNTQSNNSNSQVYTGQVTTGFEGYFKTTTYTFNYNPANFAIQFDPQQSNIVTIRELLTNTTSTMRIFNNDGAGFANSQELWNNLKLCANCQKQSNDLNIKNASDMITYSNSQEEWVVFAHDPGFVILNLKKPTDKVKPVIESLTLQTVNNK